MLAFEKTLQIRNRAIEASSNGIVIADVRLPEASIIYVNKAFERGDVSAQSLWKYNALFHKNDGAKHAGFSVLSAFIRSTSEDDVNYGFQKQLVSGEDITKANIKGGLSLSILDKFSRLKRGVGRIYLLRRMLKVAKFMKKLSQ